MNQISITLTDEQHEKLMGKLQDEAKQNVEHGILSGFRSHWKKLFRGSRG